MADPGLIALDPARLSGLEVYLDSLGDGCRRGAGRVADEVAGTGVPADHPIGELERLAALCHHERDEVAWRRALVEALPDDLPLPARTYPNAWAAEAAGLGLAVRVIAALAERPPRWGRLAHLLAELDRSAGSGPFTVRFLVALGARATRGLPEILRRAWWDAWTPPLDPQGRPTADGPTEAELAAITAVEVRLAAAIRTASQVEGEAGLPASWTRVYAGVPSADEDFARAEAAASPTQRRTAERVETELRVAGYGSRLAASVAAKLSWSQVATVLNVGSGLTRIVTAAGALDDGHGVECDGPQAALGLAGGAVLILAPASGPGLLVAGALGVGSAVFSACRRQEPRTNETTPTPDPESGTTRLPSGHASNPHVDVAGVPLPPSYG